MGTYVVACVTPNVQDPEAIAEYMRVTGPLLERARAKVLQQFSVTDVVVGNKPAESIMIVEYPDLDALHGLFDSPEYQALIPIRDRAFSTYNVTIVS